MIIWTHSIEQELELLNRHFKTTTFEKHPKAMMALLFNQTMDKVLGKNFAKQRISKKKMARIQEVLKNELQSRYGKFINISLPKSTSAPYSIKFNTNFNHAYKTEFGTLYGAQSRFYCGQVFFTFHCFERFEERCHKNIYDSILTSFIEKFKHNPTAADLVMFLTSICEMEYAKREKFYFLNVNVGFLVLEDFNEFFVAKTFLSPDMLDQSLIWYKPTFESNIIPKEFITLKSVLDHDPVKINGPKIIKCSE